MCLDGLWMWVVYDTAINIYNTENSEWFGGYCFGESLKNPGAKITAVAEFSSSHITFPCLLIAVNHDHESLICMYDINISKIIRAVLVPEMVSKSYKSSVYNFFILKLFCQCFMQVFFYDIVHIF